MHLQLVSDPITIAELEQIISQLIVVSILGLVVWHKLLLIGISFEHFLPLLAC